MPSFITSLIQHQSYFSTWPKSLSPLSVPVRASVRSTVIPVIASVILSFLAISETYAAPALAAPYKGKFIQDCKDYMSQQPGVCDCVYATLVKQYGGEKALADIDQRRVPTPKNYRSNALWAVHQCTYKK